MQIFTYQPPKLPWLDLRYIDDDIIVINKPSGLLSNPGIASYTHDCALTRLQRLYPNTILVHRLDCDTSGIMVFARHKQAESYLKTQFQNRINEKVYIAQVMGKFSSTQGQINLAIAADNNNRPLQRISAEGKEAITDYNVLEYRENEYTTTLLKLMPHTGRTHQLRVHMQAMGHTILGDHFYGDQFIKRASPRLCLHAKTLMIFHPKTTKKMIFDSFCPF